MQDDTTTDKRVTEADKVLEKVPETALNVNVMRNEALIIPTETQGSEELTAKVRITSNVKTGFALAHVPLEDPTGMNFSKNESLSNTNYDKDRSPFQAHSYGDGMLGSYDDAK